MATNLLSTNVTGPVHEKVVTATAVEAATTVPIVGTDAMLFTGNTASQAASTYTTLGKTVLAYSLAYDKPNAVVATISGDVITYGAIAVVDSGHDADHGVSIGYDQTNNKVLIIYGDQSSNIGVWMAVGTITGTSIAWGSAVQIQAGSLLVDSVRHNGMVWVGGIGSDTCNRLVSAYKNNNRDGTARVFTISGTTPTAGAEAEFTTNDPDDHCLVYIGSGAVVCAWIYNSTVVAKVGTVTGGSTNTIVWASSSTFGTAVPAMTDRLAIANDGTASYFVIAYVDGAGAAGKTYLRVGSISGTTISWGTAVEFFSDASGGADAISLTYHAASSKFLVFYKPGFGHDITSKSFTRSGTTISNLGAATALSSIDAVSPYINHSCANYDSVNKKAFVFRTRSASADHYGIAVDLLSSTLTLDLATASSFVTDLGDDTSNITAVTINNVNAVAPKTASFQLKVKQGSIPRQFKWSEGTLSTKFKWPSYWKPGVGQIYRPTVTTTNDAVDVYSFTTYDNGTTWYASIVAQAVA